MTNNEIFSKAQTAVSIFRSDHTSYTVHYHHPLYKGASRAYHTDSREKAHSFVKDTRADIALPLLGYSADQTLQFPELSLQEDWRKAVREFHKTSKHLNK